MTSKKLKTKEFNIAFEYPSEWIDTIEGDGTYLFYKEMLGSFRLSAIEIKNQKFNITSFLNGEYRDNKNYNPKWLNLGNFKFVYYKQPAKKQDNTIMHYFISGEKNILLILSYAYDSALDNTEIINTEIQKVKNTISSIKIER